MHPLSGAGHPLHWEMPFSSARKTSWVHQFQLQGPVWPQPFSSGAGFGLWHRALAVSCRFLAGWARPASAAQIPPWPPCPVALPSLLFLYPPATPDTACQTCPSPCPWDGHRRQEAGSGKPAGAGGREVDSHARGGSLSRAGAGCREVEGRHAALLRAVAMAAWQVALCAPMQMAESCHQMPITQAAQCQPRPHAAQRWPERRKTAPQLAGTTAPLAGGGCWPWRPGRIPAGVITSPALGSRNWNLQLGGLACPECRAVQPCC